MTTATSTSILDRPLALAAQVSVRPERFGALLYHFGTRRLSFLKEPKLLEVVDRLADSATARDACRAAAVPAEALGAYEAALARLVDTEMLEVR